MQFFARAARKHVGDFKWNFTNLSVWSCSFFRTVVMVLRVQFLVDACMPSQDVPLISCKDMRNIPSADPKLVNAFKGSSGN